MVWSLGVALVEGYCYVLSGGALLLGSSAEHSGPLVSGVLNGAVLHFARLYEASVSCPTS